MKHVVYWCAESWATIKSSTLEKCCNKLFDGILVDDPEGENVEKSTEDIEPLIRNLAGCYEINQEEIREWLAADDSESEFIDEDIIDMVLHPDNLSLSDDEDDDPADDRQHNADEIFNALEVRILYSRSN